MKILATLLLLSVSASGQAVFPSAVATDADLLVVRNRAQSTLTVALNSSDTTCHLASGSNFPTNSVITIGSEVIRITANGGTATPTIQRAYDGTSAASHVVGSLVSGYIVAHHHNQLAAEIEAIETALGASLAHVGTPALTSADYNFAAQTPGGSISAGSNTITLSPVPPGVNGSDTHHYLYLTAGSGTAEAVLITGGTAVASAGSGTVIVTAANSHSGAWTVTSATAGIQEAIAALGGSPGRVLIPAGAYTLRAPIQKPASQVWIQGAGMQATALTIGANFSTSVLGSFIIDDTGLASRTGPSGGYSDFSVLFTQPDSASLGDYTHWAPAFYVYNDQSPLIARIAVYRAWDVLKYLDGGGLTLYDLKASFFHRGIDADNILDTFRVEDFHATTYGLSTNQYGVFWNNASIYAMYLGYLSDGKFSKITSIAGKCVNSHQGARGGGTGLDGFASFNDLDCDTNGGFEVDGGMIRLSDSFISVGGVTSSVLTAQPAITQTGGILQVSNTKFSANGSATGPMISVDFKRDVNTGALYSPAFSLVGSVIEQSVVDQSAVTATESSAYTGTGSVLLAGNTFIKSGSGSLTNPVVSVSDGSGSIEATITGNHFSDKLAGTGDGIVLANDHYHSVIGNTGRGWTYSLAARNLTTWLNNPGFTTSTSNLIDPLHVAGKVSSSTLVSAKTENWIPSETGSNNAIAGALTDALGNNVAQSAGLRVSILLAHTLQAGGNTFALNGGAAKAIKKSSDPTANIGTAYAAGSILTLLYDGTVYQDVRQ